jgi:polysaccharide pyruvyl transferase CsaB
MGERVFIAGYYGFGNAGDEAILSGMVADLRQVIDDVELCVVSADPKATQKLHNVHTLKQSDVKSLIEAVRESDLVILGGGGLFHDYWRFDPHKMMTEEQEGLAFYLSVPQLAALHSVPCMLYGVGFGPLGDASINDQIVHALSACQLITVRDRGSVDVLRSIGMTKLIGDQHIVQTADPAFNMPLSSKEDVIQVLIKHNVPLDVPRLAVNLRYWDFGVKPDDWEAEVAQALDMWIANNDGHVVFVPFQKGAHPPYGDDSAVCERVRDRMQRSGATSLLEVFNLPSMLPNLFAHVDLVLTMRMHGVVFSLLSGTPPVGLAYDPKVSALLHEFGLGSLSLSISDWSAEKMIRALDAAGKTTEDENIKRGVRHAQAMARKNAALAVDLMGTEPKEGVAVSGGIRDMTVLKIEQVLETQRRLRLQQAELDRLLVIEQEYEGQKERLSLVSQELAGREACIDQLEITVLELEQRKKEQRQEYVQKIRALARELEEARSRYEQERSKRTDEIGSMSALLAESEVRTSHLEQQLRELRGTIAVKFMARYWGWIRRALPPGTRRHTFYRKIRSRLKSFSSPDRARVTDLETSPSRAKDGVVFHERHDELPLREFARQMEQRGSKTAIMILSATPLEESEGQRSTHLAFEFARRGKAVIFAYWRWADGDLRPQDRVEQGIYQLPLDEVMDNPMSILDACDTFDERVLFIEFPHPGFFEIVSYGNASGWITVYDVVDDWEGFHNVGQADWFEEEFEAHLVFATDLVIAVNSALQTRLERFNRAAIPLVSNGVADGFAEVSSAVELERGEITLGYFGYLSGAWFDWELVRIVASEFPAWRIYLIGYGGDQEHRSLPDNVTFLGKKPWKSLAAYAAHWDVGIIPFKRGLVSRGADPIKTYEYLALGLPIVATGVRPPEGAEDYFYVAEDAREFMESARSASRQEFHGPALASYVEGCAWSRRVDAIIDLIAAGSSQVAEKRALAKR